MSREPRKRSEDAFLGHTEPSMAQNEPQETPRKSFFLSSTETQETSPFSGGILRDSFGHGLDNGDVASMLDKQRYGKRQPYMGSAASYDSRGFLIDSVTSFSSSTGSSQQLQGQGYGTTNYNPFGSQSNFSGRSIPSTISQRNGDGSFGDPASGQGYGTTNYSDLFGHQTNISIAPGGHIPSMSRNYYTASGQGYDTISYNTFGSQSIPSMITQRNSSLITSMGSQRNSGRVLGDSGALFTGSTASSQHTYYDFETPRMQANFGGNNIASTNNYNRQSYYGRGLLGDSGAGYNTNKYNPFRHQTGGNIPSMTSQRYSSNFSDIPSMNPPRIPTPGNSNIGQFHIGQYDPLMMHNNGNLYGASVGTRTTNTSHQEPQQWTIKKQLTINDVNCLKEYWVLLPSHFVEMHIKPNISDFDKGARSMAGIYVEVYDHDRSISDGMTLVYGRYGYYLNGKWGIHIIRLRGLKVGDTIRMAWDTRRSRLLFSVLS